MGALMTLPISCGYEFVKQSYFKGVRPAGTNICAAGTFARGSEVLMQLSSEFAPRSCPSPILACPPLAL